jgi:hypothetical protein
MISLRATTPRGRTPHFGAFVGDELDPLFRHGADIYSERPGSRSGGLRAYLSRHPFPAGGTRPTQVVIAALQKSYRAS